MKMGRQTIFAVGFILMVSFNFCLTLTKTRIGFGKRRSGDRLLATDNQNYNWPQLQDVRKEITYDSKGPNISLMEVNVGTNGLTPVTYSLISGGQGQRTIAILLQAKGITNMKYTVHVYGNSAALLPSLGLITSIIMYTIYTITQ